MRSLYRVVRKDGKTRTSQAAFEYPVFSDKPNGGTAEHPEEEKKLSYLGESLVQAEKILDTARQQAVEIKQNAHDEGLAAGREEGFQAGYEAGMAEGKAAYEAKIRELEEEISDYIQDVSIEKDKLLEQYLEDLKEISLAVGEKIVRTSFRSSGQVITRMILAATDKMKKSEWAQIYIGASEGVPVDVMGDSKFLRQLSHLSDNVKIIVMDEKEAGTCIVERPGEIIDLSVGTQLDNIREIMNNARL